MRIDLLGDLGSAPAVLRAVGYAAADRGLAPPAALIGEWFGSGAVIAPSVDVAPVDTSRAFEVPCVAGDGEAVGGGWFGYLSYPDAAADGLGPRIPEAAGGWSDCVLRQDGDGRWWFESLSDATLPDWVADALRVPVAPRLSHVEWGEADRDAHRRGMLDCLEAIAAGEVYQACVCTQFRGRLEGSSLDFFADAVQRTSPARAAYLAGGWGAVASLSPELFLRRRGDHIASSPIKGTLPRSADPEALRCSVKDVAENIMIVDLVRNDLGRVADVGTVSVPELLVVQPAPGVWHLVSTVSARVPVDVPMSTVLDATFPPASVTGTPKARARRLLEDWEPVRRGIYCGTVGLASPVAGCELNVAIRTVEFDAYGNAILGVGGGITADSDPDREWEECLHKAAPIIGSLPGTQNRIVELTS
ncbi:aminodeoxychorismate synthase component I [Mycolicibacterium novocastrense]|uniref:aminodeoxychorismate synthase component I n=1 Tax=Mycolicibacterium novocastrense TaxID=59813 RepID=UPI00074A011E|nr:aminodeoxychorismate synthase component I [Mycolicibacterium novocastrense]KUH69992.1 aminodeoxychorismate synthase component I [Mycolicibacterium novocastrense]KUH78165.1 aminodeoxychorismate synthase component I [Mycolicibacterium novocastrense]KUH79500.1 aminodeoxychorismate synthase component I [Mycolicibacterium novocastrense]